MFYVLHLKPFSTGIHLDIYEPSSFKLAMMIDTIELYILILVFTAQGYNCCFTDCGKKNKL